ncbi:SusC/RagA family TonB-linked outer membrane protein [Croceivirga radicis]|uniref:SusC/RagA family TonB-linked outer membrane protein n=1 Tax=Croceivirga radicis TaxID=1929488 RepID=A0A1V6LSL7_9FLAO|nr:TonB-dependent receptor [Croceivirga radicis]OQD43181.1 SusC/RagA family TonB-linked outer membrane protein [Croceivirga radicis]
MKTFISPLSILLLAFGLVVGNQVKAQQTVTGTVMDSNKLPIPYASIIEKGTTNGVSSDFDGKFTINVNSLNKSVLNVSYVGFVAQSITLNGRSSLSIILKEDVETLDEIVVVGYGTQKKSDVTGAVSSADIEAFKEAPNTNIAQSLQGVVPGLNVGQVTSAGATPSIRIRGASTISGNSNVLIVLDGIQYNGSLSSLNPDNIESIDVLKDASSTAVYGAQAANGVLLITTKSGKKNKKPVISFSTSYTSQGPNVNLRPMRRNEYLEKVRALNYEDAYLGPDFTTPNPDFDLADYVDGTMVDGDGNLLDNDYDWWDEGTRTGYIIENKASVAGGGDNVSYLLSIGHTDQKGFILNDNFQRKNIRVNVDIDATDWWKVGIQTFGSFVNQDGDEPNIWELVTSSPLLTPYDDEGNLILSPFNTIQLNPFLAYDVQDLERHDSFFANLYSEIDFGFIKGLKYRVNFGNNYRIDKYYGSSEYGAGFTGDAGKNINFYYDYTLDNILTYNRTFNKHDLGLTLLYGAIERKGESTNAYTNGFERLTLGYNSLELGANQFTSSSAFSEQLNYQMFRLNYKFDNRYLLTGTIRRDGFSGFAANNKYGYFPSGAFGWIASNEQFLDNVEWINNLKLRVGYGVSGNQTSRYNSLASLGTRAAYVFGDGGTPAFGQELSSLPNADLKWERTTGLNIGMDFGFINNRINGNVEVYRNITNDLLFSVAIPYITGFERINTNVGKIENKGVEISLTGDIVRSNDFNWTTTLNFSTNKNEILELTGQDEDGDGVEDDLISSGLFIGESLGTYYNYETDGIYQVGEENIPDGYFPGTFRVVDQNGDGEITPVDDRVVLGRSEPAYRFSILNTFSHKNLSLSFFLNSIQGGSDSYLGYNSNVLYTSDNSIRFNYLSGIDYWQPNNPNGVNPISSTAPTITPPIYMDRSFVRLQDVSLRYSFDQELLDKLSLSGLSLFLSGKNLATWTSWRGWDPETNQGLTNGGRPVLKGYSIGLNVSF